MNSKMIQLLSHQGRVYALHEDGSLSEVVVREDGTVTFFLLWGNR